MTLSDPNSRALRGAISGAVRRGDPDLEAELRHELMLRNIETSIVKLLNGTRLTGLEVRRLRAVIDENGPQRQVTQPTRPAEPAEVERVPA